MHHHKMFCKSINYNLKIIINKNINIVLIHPQSTLYLIYTISEHCISTGGRSVCAGCPPSWPGPPSPRGTTPGPAAAGTPPPAAAGPLQPTANQSSALGCPPITAHLASPWPPAHPGPSWRQAGPGSPPLVGGCPPSGPPVTRASNEGSRRFHNHREGPY